MSGQMFCFQCEQTAGGKGCTRLGVCGKEPEVAALQDLLLYQLKGIGFWGWKSLRNGERIDDEIHRFIVDALFYTLTNVNFDPGRFMSMIDRAGAVKNVLKEKADDGQEFPPAAGHQPPATIEERLGEARKVGVMSGPALDEDIRSLREMLVIGLKGVAAYAHHAWLLGKSDEEVNAFFYRALAATLDKELTMQDLLHLNLELGKMNLRCMQLLDEAATGAYGHPEPTWVPTHRKKGPFIIVSGHDLKDLAMILEQTAGKGINVYTHGEMLPAHSYPGLKKHGHLAGNYGGAWYEQQKEFDGIPGCIVMTTNCLQKPKDSYRDRIFTTGVVGWPGVPHIYEANGSKDFSPVIDKCLALGGWESDEEQRRILVGFGRQAVLSRADKIVAAVKEGKIRRFLLIGGCDGAKPARNYYTEMAEKAPADTVILTLACGKYRFNKREFGMIEDLPRLLDIGQCNDAYSAIKIVEALAVAFRCGINDLPLSLVLSWYEQKAVAILLSLLYLGVRRIRLGPSLPAFISPNVLNTLVEKFELLPISDAENDLKVILGE